MERFTAKGFFKRTNTQLLIEIYNAIKQIVPSAKKGIDFGCGDGFFCEEMSKKGIVFDGIEFDPKLVTLANSNMKSGGKVIEGDFSEKLNQIEISKYDVVYQYCDIHPKSKLENIDYVIKTLKALRKPPVFFALTSSYGVTSIKANEVIKIGSLKLKVYKF